jgi:hypothetical protein
LTLAAADPLSSVSAPWCRLVLDGDGLGAELAASAMAGIAKAAAPSAAAAPMAIDVTWIFLLIRPPT